MPNPHKNREKRGDMRKKAAQSSSFTGMETVQRESQPDTGEDRPARVSVRPSRAVQ